MKRTLALMGMTMAVCAVVSAQDTGNRVVVPSRNGSRPRTVEASLTHGSITVKVGSGADVIAEAPGVRQRPSDRNVPPGMHRLDLPARGGIQVSENGDVLHISLGFGAPEERSLVLTVPTNTNLRLHTTHGDLNVTGVHGEIDAASTHGEITLTNVGGTVLSNTLHGSITATMDQVDQAKPLSFSTLNGNIDVTMPASTRLNLKMKTDHGDIWSDFDVKLTGGGASTQSGGRVNGLSRLMMDRTLRGTINGGGVDASLYTVNGRITIRKK